jgi:hypothetical protein
VAGRRELELAADLLGHLAHVAQVERAVAPRGRADAQQRQLRIGERVGGIVRRAQAALARARGQLVEAGLEHGAGRARIDRPSAPGDADHLVAVARERAP